MLRTAAAIAVAVVVALVALRFVTGIVGGLLGALFALAWVAFKVLIFVGIAYFVLTVISPDTARKVRDSAARSSSVYGRPPSRIRRRSTPAENDEPLPVMTSARSDAVTASVRASAAPRPGRRPDRARCAGRRRHPDPR